MNLKQLVKTKLIKGQQNRYFRELENKTVSYHEWVVRQEADISDCLDGEEGKECDDIVLFCAADGKTAEYAEELVKEFFINNPQVAIVYVDEDVMSPEGIRYTPWLKPDWSPDTFLAQFYFGSFFAVRSCLLAELTKEECTINCNRSMIIIDEQDKEKLYQMCFRLVKKAGGFEKRKEGDSFHFPIGHIDNVLFHSFTNKEMNRVEDRALFSLDEGKEDVKEDTTVSIIIPSKDNVEVLKHCIESIENTTTFSHEIIVVDNGSSEASKAILDEYLQQKGITYLYKKMDFNFSAMCNLGAKQAKGSVYLFYNDDVEARVQKTGEDWLQKLCEKALCSYTGAVGVKLLYPSTDRIQHAGIVNLRLGPVHKLQFKNDNTRYYYGWNRGNHNVIGVTGACLAVSADKFKEVSGFYEELPVAFNDVDLCFSLFEKGYYNVVLQDVVLYHHESLSRGTDAEVEKLERLLEEKRKLYKRHSSLYAKDPFYHKYLASDILSSDFILRSDYEEYEENEGKTSRPFLKMNRNNQILEKAREDACVYISLEYAGTIQEWECGVTTEANGGQSDYYVQGYSFVTGSDNAVYEKQLLLKNGEDIYTLFPESVIRKDVEENLPDQIHVAMTGFSAKINGKDIPLGKYRIGILVKDRCSRQMLYSWTNRYLVVK